MDPVLRSLGVRAPAPGLVRWGLRAWLLVGVLLAAGALAWLLSQVSGLVVPLVLASVVGALFAPTVDRMVRLRVPRPLGAVAVLVGLVAVVVWSVWLVVAAVVDQGSRIKNQVTAGLDVLDTWLQSREVDLGSSGALSDELGGLSDRLLAGIASFVPGLFSGTASFLFGSFVAAFLLYYVLVDWDGLVRWVGGHLGLEPETGAAVVGDAVQSVRRYFGALTASSLVTAVLIGVTARLLDVPLALTIAVITFTTSYVPYLGAIFSGAFATLVALGSAGVETAVLLLVVVLVVQNVVQTVVLTRMTSTALRLHPIVTLGSTLVGAAFAGALGATLSSPMVAAVLLVQRRLGDAGSPEDVGGSDQARPPARTQPGD
jgi:predicted PurR-regulated permease PerM